MSGSTVLVRPTDRQPHYGRHLADAGYWGPYVAEVLKREGLPGGRPVSGFPGTFPTFLVGDLVVKLYGEAFDGGASWEAEVEMHRLLAGQPAIPAPALVASGTLWPDHRRWPYLVTERLPGVALRDQPESRTPDLAAEIGAAVGPLHRLVPTSAVLARETVSTLRLGAAARMASYGLPVHLAEQVPQFLSDAESPNVLVHGDITADHVFVSGGRLVGIIDWGDAVRADRSYELPAVWLDAMAGDSACLNAFLDGAGWTRSADLARRLLQGVLEFQFDAIGGLSELFDLRSFRSLTDLVAAIATRIESAAR